MAVIARSGDVDNLRILRVMMADLVERVQHSPTEGAVVLPRGGSTRTIMKAYTSYLGTHLEYLDDLIVKVLDVLAVSGVVAVPSGEL